MTFDDLVGCNPVGDLWYDGNDEGGNEYLSKYSTTRGNTILKFCGVMINNGELCNGDPGGLTYINIVFVRPETDALFKSNTAVAFQAVKIYLRAKDGATRVVRVRSTGQISVCGAGGC